MTLNSGDVVAGTNATATEYNNLRKDLVTGQNTIVTATDGATVTFDLDDGKLQQVTLGGNRTFAISNMSAGQVLLIRIVQDGTGSRTVTWFSTIKWADDVEPTLSTTASRVDLIGILCTGSGTYDGIVVAQNLY